MLVIQLRGPYIGNNTMATLEGAKVPIHFQIHTFKQDGLQHMNSKLIIPKLRSNCIVHKRVWYTWTQR